MKRDLHTTAGKIEDLRDRLDEAVHAGSARAIEKQHAKGKMTARERIAKLVDEGSFTELDEFARHRSTNFDMQNNRPYGDGVVVGYGTVDGRNIALYSQDFTVMGGSLGEVIGRENYQNCGVCTQEWNAADWHQRLWRCTYSRGRRITEWLTEESFASILARQGLFHRSR
jgi:acetyl-CoA carboxylase carboxyltransferase component